MRLKLKENPDGLTEVQLRWGNGSIVDSIKIRIPESSAVSEFGEISELFNYCESINNFDNFLLSVGKKYPPKDVMYSDTYYLVAAMPLDMYYIIELCKNPKEAYDRSKYLLTQTENCTIGILPINTDTEVQFIHQHAKDYLAKGKISSLYRELCREFSDRRHVAVLLGYNGGIKTYQFDSAEAAFLNKDKLFKNRECEVYAGYTIYSEDYVTKLLDVDDTMEKTVDVLKSIGLDVKDLDFKNKENQDMESSNGILSIVECLPDAAVADCKTAKELATLLKDYL